MIKKRDEVLDETELMMNGVDSLVPADSRMWMSAVNKRVVCWEVLIG